MSENFCEGELHQCQNMLENVRKGQKMSERNSAWLYTYKNFEKFWGVLNKVLVDSSEDKKVSLWQVKKVYFWNKKEVSRFRLFFNWPPDIQFTPFMHEISAFRFFKWSLILVTKIILKFRVQRTTRRPKSVRVQAFLLEIRSVGAEFWEK